VASSAVSAFSRFLAEVLAIDDMLAGTLRRSEGVPGEYGGPWVRALAGDARAEERLRDTDAALWRDALGQVRSEIDRAGSFATILPSLAAAPAGVPTSWPVTFPSGVRLTARDVVDRIRTRRSIQIDLRPKVIPQWQGEILFTAEVRDLCSASPAALLGALRALDETVGQEPAAPPVPVVLGLPGDGTGCVMRDAMREAVATAGGFPHVRLWAFTEDDVRALVSRVLIPAASHYLHAPNPAKALTVFGVDGRGGRTFTFLQAVAVLWQMLLDPGIAAVIRMEGTAGDERFAFPDVRLWGAAGRDTAGRPIATGFIASDRVDETARPERVADRVFDPDLGRRVGSAAANTTDPIAAAGIAAETVGSLVTALTEHRPFAPAFLGTGAGTMFLAGAAAGSGARPVYLESGLLRNAAASKPVEEEQVVLMSAYARALGRFEELLANDPVPGAFLSRLPLTVAWLRTAVTSAAVPDPAAATATAKRVADAAAFVAGGGAERRLAVERGGWSVYYDVLAALGKKLVAGDPYALALRHRARSLVAALRL
jgi:hypothetical protein